MNIEKQVKKKSIAEILARLSQGKIGKHEFSVLISNENVLADEEYERDLEDITTIEFAEYAAMLARIGYDDTRLIEYAMSFLDDYKTDHPTPVTNENGFTDIKRELKSYRDWLENDRIRFNDYMLLDPSAIILLIAKDQDLIDTAERRLSLQKARMKQIENIFEDIISAEKRQQQEEQEEQEEKEEKDTETKRTKKNTRKIDSEKWKTHPRLSAHTMIALGTNLDNDEKKRTIPHIIKQQNGLISTDNKDWVMDLTPQKLDELRKENKATHDCIQAIAEYRKTHKHEENTRLERAMITAWLIQQHETGHATPRQENALAFILKTPLPRTIAVINSAIRANDVPSTYKERVFFIEETCEYGYPSTLNKADNACYQHDNRKKLDEILKDNGWERLEGPDVPQQYAKIMFGDSIQEHGDKNYDDEKGSAFITLIGRKRANNKTGSAQRTCDQIVKSDLEELTQALDIIREDKQHTMIAMPTCTFHGGKRDKRQATEVFALKCDIDDVPANELQRALKRIENGDLPEPTDITTTNSGTHIDFMLKKPKRVKPVKKTGTFGYGKGIEKGLDVLDKVLLEVFWSALSEKTPESKARVDNLNMNGIINMHETSRQWQQSPHYSPLFDEHRWSFIDQNLIHNAPKPEEFIEQLRNEIKRLETIAREEEEKKNEKKKKNNKNGKSNKNTNANKKDDDKTLDPGKHICFDGDHMLETKKKMARLSLTQSYGLPGTMTKQYSGSFANANDMIGTSTQEYGSWFSPYHKKTTCSNILESPTVWMQLWRETVMMIEGTLPSPAKTLNKGSSREKRLEFITENIGIDISSYGSFEQTLTQIAYNYAKWFTKRLNVPVNEVARELGVKEKLDKTDGMIMCDWLQADSFDELMEDMILMLIGWSDPFDLFIWFVDAKNGRKGRKQRDKRMKRDLGYTLTEIRKHVAEKEGKNRPRSGSKTTKLAVGYADYRKGSTTKFIRGTMPWQVFDSITSQPLPKDFQYSRKYRFDTLIETINNAGDINGCRYLTIREIGVCARACGIQPANTYRICKELQNKWNKMAVRNNHDLFRDDELDTALTLSSRTASSFVSWRKAYEICGLSYPSAKLRTLDRDYEAKTRRRTRGTKRLESTNRRDVRRALLSSYGNSGCLMQLVADTMIMMVIDANDLDADDISSMNLANLACLLSGVRVHDIATIAGVSDRTVRRYRALAIQCIIEQVRLDRVNNREYGVRSLFGTGVDIVDSVGNRSVSSRGLRDPWGMMKWSGSVMAGSGSMFWSKTKDGLNGFRFNDGFDGFVLGFGSSGESRTSISSTSSSAMSSVIAMETGLSIYSGFEGAPLIGSPFINNIQIGRNCPRSSRAPNADTDSMMGSSSTFRRDRHP